ncbi:MAG: C45 family peptidase [Thermoplasmata archaeon]|nr:C45 family peptidase [Thermoplasmata archaeon]
MESSTKKMAAAVVVAVVVIAAVAVAISQNGSDDSGGKGVTFTWSEDSTLFYIDVDADYNFDKYLETGVSDINDFYAYLEENVTNGTKITGVSGNTGCSTFSATTTDGDEIMARNFDFRVCEAGVVYTDPDDGYASLSIIDMTMFSYTEGDTPETLTGNDAYLAAAYIPMDGVNEKGVSVSINSVNNGHTISMDNGKTKLFITSALRLILDYAATTEEALDLLDDYDYWGGHYHILISDATGNSVDVEFDGNTMYTTTTDLMTNHYLATELQNLSDVTVTESSKNRYNTIQTTLTETSGVMTVDEALGLLETVKQDDGPSHQTKWSVVYNKTDLTMTVCILMDYDTRYTISLGSSEIIQEVVNSDTTTTTTSLLAACAA